MHFRKQPLLNVLSAEKSSMDAAECWASNISLSANQKWHLQKSASDDDEVKIELRPVLAQFKANLSFPTPGMLLSDL